ncbi:hypothetical protein MWU38_03210 [Qipengyuania sp. S6317L1]|nr:hypothetical protein [Qipengyuania sp. S6317L1]
MPAEVGLDPFQGGTVKEMTLLKRSVSSDKVDAYRDDAPAEYDVKLSLIAKGKASFGVLRELTPEKVRKAGYSIASFEEFDKASVKVKLNGASKQVTMIGSQGEAGVIDVTDEEDLVLDEGHPTIASLDKVSKPLLKHFHEALIGYKK